MRNTESRLWRPSTRTSQDPSSSWARVNRVAARAAHIATVSNRKAPIFHTTKTPPLSRFDTRPYSAATAGFRTRGMSPNMPAAPPLATKERSPISMTPAMSTVTMIVLERVSRHTTARTEVTDRLTELRARRNNSGRSLRVTLRDRVPQSPSTRRAPRRTARANQ